MTQSYTLLLAYTQEPEVTQSTIKSPTLKSRKKKRRSRKWSASKGEAPAAAAKEKEREEPVDSATEIPSASGIQVNNFCHQILKVKVQYVCGLALVEAGMFLMMSLCLLF